MHGWDNYNGSTMKSTASKRSDLTEKWDDRADKLACVICGAYTGNTHKGHHVCPTHAAIFATLTDASSKRTCTDRDGTFYALAAHRGTLDAAGTPFGCIRVDALPTTAGGRINLRVTEGDRWVSRDVEVTIRPEAVEAFCAALMEAAEHAKGLPAVLTQAPTVGTPPPAKTRLRVAPKAKAKGKGKAKAWKGPATARRAPPEYLARLGLASSPDVKEEK